MKIALVGPTDRSIWTFRRGLIAALLTCGHAVCVLCPSGNYTEAICSLGAVHIPVRVARFTDPVADLRYALQLYRVFRAHRFDIVHAFTVKPNMCAPIAARLAGIPQVFLLVEGLGFGYPEGQGLRARLSRCLFLTLYRLPCSLSTRIWFINQDDMDLFISRNLVKPENTVFIRSVGVDANHFSRNAVRRCDIVRLRRELGGDDRTLYVSMVARMVWSKGVREFVDAARLLQTGYPRARFLLVGEIQDGSPLSVPRDYLTDGVPQNVRWLGFRSDVREVLALSDVVVLPSYYREGVPRSLLEAMAMAKPVVTTDWPGCREVVINDCNGFLVPVKDPEALADAISRLLDDPQKCLTFGACGRTRVERQLDEKLVVQRVMRELYGIVG